MGLLKVTGPYPLLRQLRPAGRGPGNARSGSRLGVRVPLQGLTNADVTGQRSHLYGSLEPPAKSAARGW